MKDIEFLKFIKEKMPFPEEMPLLGADQIFKKEILNLQDVYSVYQRWLHLESTDRIDLGLAIYLTRKMEGTPIWIIFVGPSGDAKSEQILALRNDETTYLLHNLTSKALVSGNPQVPDLAPELHGKVVIIPDMAQLLHLHPNEKAEVWSQLRDLFDGYAGKASGLGKRAKYEGLRITLMACSTPSIDAQLLIHQDLGTRELVYRTKVNKKQEELMNKCLENEEFEKQMRQEIREVTSKFLQKIEFKRKEVSVECIEEIKKMVYYLTYMRASADVDGYTGELRNIVYPEQPTRVIKQFKRIFLALINLEENYPIDKALRILWHIALSSSFPIRVEVFNRLLTLSQLDALNEWTTSHIANDVKIGKKTAQKELYILWNMGLVTRRYEEMNDRYLFEKWRVNLENPLTIKLMSSYNSPPSPNSK